MKFGNLKIFIFLFTLFFANISSIFAEDQIQSVPLINLEELSPTFEEDKDELEDVVDQNVNLNYSENNQEENKVKKNEKIYINITALDKITAKTSTLNIKLGEEKYFGNLKIKPLKCKASEIDQTPDTVAYLQVIDMSDKKNDQVFVFNGWTFASSPTLRSLDHAIYDLWLLGCSNT